MLEKEKEIISTKLKSISIGDEFRFYYHVLDLHCLALMKSLQEQQWKKVKVPGEKQVEWKKK